MAATNDQPSPTFIRELRRALRHYYNPGELGKSPLMQILPADPREGPSSLQRILATAIEDLKPHGQMSGQSSAWRIYQTLASRYIQQFQQTEVAAELGLSIRQLARQQNLALEVLAGHLWRRYGLRDKAPVLPLPPRPVAASSPAAEPRALSREDELRWFQESLPDEAVAIGEVIEALLETVSPLARAMGVRVQSAAAEDLPRLVVRLPALRQALLNLLTAAMRCVPGGEVSIAAQTHGQDLLIVLRPRRVCPGFAAAIEEQSEAVEMARQLLQLSGGSLELGPAEGKDCPFTFRLVLPAVRQIPVLVIDDNADALHLFQHYLAGSRYALAGACDAQQALALAETLKPRVIVLDIMLPGVDGWEVLGRLREHPNIRGVPIVACTILPQEQLALALGAAAFLRKPVSRAELLATLERVVKA